MQSPNQLPDYQITRLPDEVDGTSLWKNAWRRLLRNRLAVFGLIMVGSGRGGVARRPADYPRDHRLYLRLHPGRRQT